MNFALGDIRGMKDPLSNLLDKEIPIMAAWKLNRLIKSFDKELNEIEEFRIGLVKKLGSEDETGKIQVVDDKMEQFIGEFNELLKTEVSIEYDPIGIDTFCDINMSAKDLMLLEKLFV